VTGAVLLSLKDTIDRFGLAAKKSLGQHFLLDSNITAKIARGAGDVRGVTLFEIGPGPGGLTRSLLETDAAKVIAIEKDARCIAALSALQEAYGERFELREEDALRVALTSLAPAPRAIVANLPYNIGTELVIRFLQDLYADPHAYQSITVMLQKEVAERLAASPRSKEYGRLSVLAQFLCNVDLLFDLPPGAFSPPPKVTSTVVRLLPKPHADIALKSLENVTRAAFGNRRKMLRQSLKMLHPDPTAWCEAAGIAATQRAEDLGVEEYVRLVECFCV
jgi:16S rRNA (adenine1518-N6/adenine1519-N6)-dimethyltransferase